MPGEADLIVNGEFFFYDIEPNKVTTSDRYHLQCIEEVCFGSQKLHSRSQVV